MTASLKVAPAASADARWSRLRLAAWAPAIVLVLLCLIIAAINHNFLTFGNFVRMSQDAAIPLVLGLGETFIILMGSIDLSVEGILTLAAVILSMTVLNGMNDNNLGVFAVLLVLAVGAAVGFANGVVHVRLKVPSFMATLGSWFIGVGIANALLGGMAIRINDPLIRGLAIRASARLSMGRMVGARLSCGGFRHPEPYASRPLYLRSRGRRGTRSPIRHFGLLGSYRHLHPGGCLLRHRRSPGRGATRSWERADRQRSPLHHGDSRRRRRNVALRGRGRRAADLRRRADRLRIVERHGAHGRSAERSDRTSGPHDHRGCGAVHRSQDAGREMSASPDAAISMVGIGKRFPGVHALKNVSIEIKPGEVVGLIGENGAGKSTLMKILSGVYQPDAGQIFIAGKETRIESAADANRKGIGMVFQEQSLLPNLTIGENIYLGNERQFTKFGLVNWRALYDAAARQLVKVKVDIDPRTRADELSFAARQMVELAKALTLEEHAAGHLVILLDEPTSVLERADIDILFDRVRALKSRASFVFVSHRLDEVLQVSDRVYVMKDGEVVAELAAADANVAMLHRLMVGRTLASRLLL